VNWLPYDSIEVVFNDKNVWANHQHHHPACITYNLPNVEMRDFSSDWYPLLQQGDLEKMQYETADFPLPAPLRTHDLTVVESKCQTELEENLKLARNKKGFDALLEGNKDVKEHLKLFLEMQEAMWYLDPDFRPPFEEELAKGERPWMSKLNVEPWSGEAADYFKTHMRHRMPVCNGRGSAWIEHPDGIKGYVASQNFLWKAFSRKIDNWLKKRLSLPVRRGRTFRGFPVHFSTSETEIIRAYLMDLEEYKQYMDIKHENVWYSIEVLMKPLQGGIQSTWVYVGVQLPKGEKIVDSLGGTDPAKS